MVPDYGVRDLAGLRDQGTLVGDRPLCPSTATASRGRDPGRISLLVPEVVRRGLGLPCGLVH